MKIVTGNYTNTEVTTGRDYGAATNNPGDNTGTGADKETFNDVIYGHLSVIDSYKEDGYSNADETLLASDTRDAIEELTSKKVNGVANWESTDTYLTDQLVMYKGFQFYAYNTTGNLAKPPLEFPDYWYYSGTPEYLMTMHYDGIPREGGLSDIADRDETNYKQSALVAKYRLGGAGETFYNFYRIALDGTTVTGDANLEAILNGYWNLDLIAPDVLGTRTLLDLGEVVGTKYIIVMQAV